MVIQAYQDPVARRDEIIKAQKRHFARWDWYLDTNLEGNHWLKNPEIVQILKESFHFWDKKSYELIAYTILSNHFHIVLDMTDETRHTKPLYRIMQTMKSYTANIANKALSRTGTFWQEESYDHVVRNAQELKNIITYVLENPVNAGLVEDWQKYPHSFVNENYL